MRPCIALSKTPFSETFLFVFPCKWWTCHHVDQPSPCGSTILKTICAWFYFFKCVLKSWTELTLFHAVTIPVAWTVSCCVASECAAPSSVFSRKCTQRCPACSASRSERQMVITSNTCRDVLLPLKLWKSAGQNDEWQQCWICIQCMSTQLCHRILLLSHN